MVLSARSCGIEEAFTEDIVDKSAFHVQRKPKKKERARPVEEIVRERLKKPKEEEESREKMLDKRVKLKNDKFAWF